MPGAAAGALLVGDAFVDISATSTRPAKFSLAIARGGNVRALVSRLDVAGGTLVVVDDRGRNRKPCRCSALRSASSGLVSVRRLARMFADRPGVGGIRPAGIRSGGLGWSATRPG